MGLTNHSTGQQVLDSQLIIRKKTSRDKVIALAGNPNVGKSTIFNNLTHSSQHTGNWPGKTIANAQGYCTDPRYPYIFVDLPGTYSLMAHSAEEEIARNYICFGRSDTILVICDAVCLEHNLNLVLQTLEITSSVIVCVNLMDEAKKKGITIHLNRLSALLGNIPVIGTSARNKETLPPLLEAIEERLSTALPPFSPLLSYPEELEQAIRTLCSALKKLPSHSERLQQDPVFLRWLSLRLLDSDVSLLSELEKELGLNPLEDPDFARCLNSCRQELQLAGMYETALKDTITSVLMKRAAEIADACVSLPSGDPAARDRRIDRILTSRTFGYPIMLLLLAGIFWITISGANYPSAVISRVLFRLQEKLRTFLVLLSVPVRLQGFLIDGVYRVTAWVVSVMLPPMAIFFPLFTLLEDSGYLPRIAFNLDRPFQKCCACGKQSLTMCMGFGCNAAGVIGCRIIDSPRERLIAILTNNFVPCNGRFPMMITLLSVFFAYGAFGLSSWISALMLTGLVLTGILITLGISRLLSATLLKGIPSSFTLELPPYRRPQLLQVLVRSVYDRTFFVLRRAAGIALPAGAVIWLLANISVHNRTLLVCLSDLLDPFAILLGMDGVILLAFILGFPANEIVVPLIIMSYTAGGTLLEIDNMQELKMLLTANGWTWATAVSTLLFSLCHWPCATTLLTIKKETGSRRRTAAAFLIPTLTGMLLCFIFNTVLRLCR